MSVPLALVHLLNAVRRLPTAIAQSLNPANLQDARIVDAQLDFVQTSVRRLDWALPLAAAASSTLAI